MNKGNDSAKRLRMVIDRLTGDGKTIARLDNSDHEIFPVAISPAEGVALQDWVRREAASHTIEIGLAYGFSALFICEALLQNGHTDVRHTVVDPYQSAGFKNCGLQLLEEAGVSQLVEHHEEESQILLPRFVSEGRKFDFAFVDGSHLFERVFLDLIYLARLVRPGGVIFLDDYQMPAIAKAASFCVNNFAWILEEVSAADEHHQWAVLRSAHDPVIRTYLDFTDF